jgi:hypothetical protein
VCAWGVSAFLPNGILPCEGFLFFKKKHGIFFQPLSFLEVQCESGVIAPVLGISASWR